MEKGISLGEIVEFLASDVVIGHMLKEDKKFYEFLSGEHGHKVVR